MTTNQIDDDGLRAVVLALDAHGGHRTKTAETLGIPRSTLLGALKRARKAGILNDGGPGSPGGEPDLTVHLPAPVHGNVEDLIEHRIKAFERKRMHEDSRRLIRVDVREALPIGILHMGDPHVDDDGTDLALLRRDSDLTRTVEGLYAANVGDTTNNWVGRLARLYGEQETSASQAWQLAEWLVKRTRWIYLVGGNHDGWSGSGDPLSWICRQAGALYQDSEVRVELRFPNGAAFRINCRHDFAGNSQWNPTHGPMKALQMGLRDHIAICGHKHVSGYGVLKDPHSKAVCHAIQVGSYKTFDRYARERGFRDQMLGPAVVTVINPLLPDTHPDAIKLFWDAAEGADYLTFVRGRAKKARAA